MFASTNIWSKHTYLNSFKQSIFKPKKVTVCFRSWCVVLCCKFNRKSQHHPDLNKQTYHQGKYINIYLHYHKMDCSLLLKRINIMYILVYTCIYACIYFISSLCLYTCIYSYVKDFSISKFLSFVSS